jgi:hypothetical protein
MKYRLIKEEIAYTGEQLRSNFAYRQFGVVGDSIVAFCGKCDINLREMVDIEDIRGGKAIFSESMLHFIIEHFDVDLEKMVLRQIVLTCIVKDMLNTYVKGDIVHRIGSDLFEGDAKLTVSVATSSPVSSLVHFGVNITSANTPVKTKGLKDYNIDPYEFANAVMDRYSKENDKLYVARCKVRWVQ